MAEPYTPGLVWAQPSGAGQTSRLTLDRAQIVKAAIELLDEGGLDGLTMRRLGAKLGAGATSMYWHVANKDALLDIVFDEVMAELAPVRFTEQWQADIRTALHDIRALIFRHPWTAALHATRPSIGPHTLQWDGPFIDRLAKAGFSGAALDHAWWMLMDYVIGTTATQIKWDAWLSGSEADLAAVRAYAWEAIAEYPAYREYIDTYLLVTDPAEVRSGRFEFGLDCLLDGLAIRLERR